LVVVENSSIDKKKTCIDYTFCNFSDDDTKVNYTLKIQYM